MLGVNKMTDAYTTVGHAIDSGQYSKESHRTLHKYLDILQQERFPEGTPIIFHERRERLSDLVKREIENKKTKRKERFDKYLFPLCLGLLFVLLAFLLHLLWLQPKEKIESNTTQQQYKVTTEANQSKTKIDQSKQKTK
jgi:hypothetical protein